MEYGGKVEPLPLQPTTPDDKESYLLMNTVNAVRLPDNEPLEFLDIAIELDMDSFTWQLSATVANKAVLALIEPDANGTKDIQITINGWDWVFMVTRYDAERRFGSRALSHLWRKPHPTSISTLRTSAQQDRRQCHFSHTGSNGGAHQYRIHIILGLHRDMGDT